MLLARSPIAVIFRRIVFRIAHRFSSMAFLTNSDMEGPAGTRRAPTQRDLCGTHNLFYFHPLLVSAVPVAHSIRHSSPPSVMPYAVRPIVRGVRRADGNLTDPASRAGDSSRPQRVTASSR